MVIIDISYFGSLKYPSDSEMQVDVKRASIERLAPPVVANAIANSYGHSGAWEGFIEEKYKSGYMEFSCLRNHHGTHVDAPAHKILGGKGICDYGVDKFINLAKLIDLTGRGILEREKRVVMAEDLEGKLDFDSDVGALVFYTGFCDEMAVIDKGIKDGEISDEEKFRFEKTFPYFSEEAVKYVKDVFPKLDVVGIDSFSVDASGSNSEVHRAFFGEDICLLETVYDLGFLRVNLGAERCDDFVLNSVPLKWGFDAAPCRAYALIE